MATKQFIKLGKQFKTTFKEPILEIGSKIWPGYENVSPRVLHDKNSDYIGIDVEDGKGVDHVIDLSSKTLNIDEIGWEKKFNTIHLHCILEHVADIFTFSKNIEKILKVGGFLYLTVPFSWKIHRIPIDMWRFTPQSIDYLFPKIKFKKKNCFYSTRRMNELIPVDKGPKEFHLGSKIKNHGVVISTLIRILRRLKLDKNIFSERALLLETNLIMIGQKNNKNNSTFISSNYF